MRPVLAQLIHISDLDNCRVTLDHIAELHDALDAREENERRAYAASKKG